MEAKRISKSTSVLLALVVATSLTAGCGSHGRGRMDPEKVKKFISWRMNDLLDDLDATDTQRDGINAVKERLVDDMLALREGGKEARRALLDELMKDAPDSAAMHARVDQMIEQMRTFAHEAVDASVEIHGVLTPAQREALAGEIASHREDR